MKMPNCSLVMAVVIFCAHSSCHVIDYFILCDICTVCGVYLTVVSCYYVLIHILYVLVTFAITNLLVGPVHRARK